jgi:hypothetical protein
MYDLASNGPYGFNFHAGVGSGLVVVPFGNMLASRLVNWLLNISIGEIGTGGVAA